MTDQPVPETDAFEPSPLRGGARSVVYETAKAMRVLLVAGIPTGVVVAGLGNRFAMFALRITSSDRVNGVESDDGFTIGRVTLFGTYNLLMLGAAVGIIGAAAYQWVRPWLLGPTWFRYVTLGLGSGAVVGSMLVHADGIDFRVLGPIWFAIALFVALPALFAVCVAAAVERVEHRPVPSGRRRVILPVLLMLAFPLTIFVAVVASFVVASWFAVRQTVDVHALVRRPAIVLAVRAVWLGIAVIGVLALANDISEIRRVN